MISSISTSTSITEVLDGSPMTFFQWRAVALCCLINMLDGFDFMVMAFTAASVSAHWSLRGTQLGYLLSAGLIGMTVGSLFIAPLADRIGRRTLVLGCPRCRWRHGRIKLCADPGAARRASFYYRTWHWRHPCQQLCDCRRICVEALAQLGHQLTGHRLCSRCHCRRPDYCQDHCPNRLGNSISVRWRYHLTHASSPLCVAPRVPVLPPQPSLSDALPCINSIL